MKITKNTKHTLLKLHLLKHQMYKNLSNNSLTCNVENQEINLKKILKIIYLYHTSKKKILFIGFPYNNLLTTSINHTFLPKVSRTVYTSGRLLNNFDLIVFYNQNDKDIVLFKELSKLGVPLIFVGNSETLNTNRFNFYSSVFLVSSKNFKKFWFFLIFSVLKKSI